VSFDQLPDHKKSNHDITLKDTESPLGKPWWVFDRAE